MSPIEAIRVALIAIRANKMRSALTMLGIIIGVGSVITMIALGRGAGADITDRVKSMGTNRLTVQPGARQPGAFGRRSAGDREALKVADAEAIAQKCPSVAAVAPQASGSAEVKRRNQNATITVAGSTPEYFVVNNHPVERGRAFTEAEDRGKRTVCVIGTTVVSTFFGRSDPLGESLRIKNVSFEIIGVLKEKGGGGFRDPDEIIVVPLNVAMGRLFGSDYLNSIPVMAAGGDLLGQATEEINKLLRRRHRIRPGKQDDFNVRGQAEMLEMFTQTSQTFTVLLAGIAALSLLVGGIGVMNIMLVSVTERTREIGIRKAVGARRRDILMQFLIESLALCMVGGLIGTAVGIAGAAVVAKVAGWRTLVSGASILLAFGFSAAVGIGFGIYPAQKAALLHPIEALRYE